ncbi:PLP-dependent aminotransferase family protein [Salinicoccus sesuvii]|uniref:PLP-dependent aminotransferase family protein n=1 Tax=Salinicoccus sesuvii TaxID=868281 RepID=A0ABV7N353_9STAP
MLITLDRQSDIPLFEQLYNALKSQILEGTLDSNKKLPSKRLLQADLSISQTTVEHAYQLLLDEDLIYSREKSGFYVSAIDQLRQTASPVAARIKRPKQNEQALPIDTIDTTLVQSDVLKNIAREVYTIPELLNKGDDSGETVLKEQIRQYLRINRGVTCAVDQIFIGPSTEFLLEQALYLLGHPRVTIEDPGYPVVRKVLDRLDNGMDSARVLQDGIDIDQVKALNNPVVHVTPSHQFPSGAVMSLQKRIRLLNHASSQNHYIIEDDYDSEFRYTGRPLPSLQGLDQNDRTIYMSTFSKSLYPSLRLACMVLPAALAEKYYDNALSCNVPRQMQHIVANFMVQGYLNRHINRMRKIYRKKMRDVTQWLQTFEGVEIYGDHTGMHFMLRIPGIDIESFARSHHLVHGNVYSETGVLSDTVVIGIGEKDTGEIIKILDAFLKDCQTSAVKKSP